MRKKAINKAIAEILGRKYHEPTEDEIASGSYYQYEPDFTSDLNAMHEAEKVLTDEQQGDYVCRIGGIHSSPGRAMFACAHATAAKRAEAFLKTLGLWETK